jgi:hypothetical protein
MEDENFNPDGIVIVSVPVGAMGAARLISGSRIPVDKEEKFVFKTVTLGDYEAVTRASERIEVRPDGSIFDIGSPFEFDRYLIFRCLVETTAIDGELVRRGGWLDAKSRAAVGGIAGFIIDTAIYLYKKSYAIDDVEETELGKQSHMLFSGNGHVSDPLPAISKFCNVSAFAEKFNIPMSDVDNVPFADFIRMRKIMDAESEAYKRKAASNNGPVSSASFGGVISKGGGVVIPG